MGADAPPMHIADAEILRAPDRDAPKFQADGETVFILGLAPHSKYDVEVDDQELWEEETDNGGTMVLALPEGTNSAVRMKLRK